MAENNNDNAVSNMLAAYLTKKTKNGVNLVGDGELPSWEVLDHVCTETRVSFGINSVAKAFTEDGKRLLLALLGVSRMVRRPAGGVISFSNLQKFRSTKSYHAGDVFASKIGAGTALHRLITDFQHVYHYVKGHIKQYGDHGLPVFILLEPSAQKVDLNTAITAKLTIQENPVQVFWNAEGRWQVAPLANVAVYSLLLSMHLRMLARPALVPWTRNEVLTPPVLQLPPYLPLPQRFDVNAEVYFYVRQLYERDPNLLIQDPAVNFPPNVGSLEEDWLDEQRALHSQPPQQQQEGEEEEQDEQSQMGGGPPGIQEDTSVIKFLLSHLLVGEHLRPLRKFAGVYVLLPQRSADGHLCYARLPDTFTQDANDGACPFSRTGTLSLSQGGKVDKGTRAGRVAVHADVARLFRNNDCGERPALVLECHGQSGALVGVRDETGRTLTMPELLGQVLNQNQVLQRDLRLPDWFLHFHSFAAGKAATPLPPADPADAGRASDAMSEASDGNMSCSDGEGRGASGRGRKRGSGAADGVVECVNRLTAGDLAALVMADHLWRGPFPAGCEALSAPLPVVWELPRGLLTRLLFARFGDPLDQKVYRYFLEPTAGLAEAVKSEQGGSAGPAPTPNAQGGEAFFLQDLLTVMNAFGQTGEVVNDLRDFLRREIKVLMRDGHEFAVTLPTERLHPRTTSGDANRVTISLSSSEAATLTMHMYWKGEGELHSRLEYKEDDGGALIPTLDGWRDKLLPHVAWQDVGAVAEFFASGHGSKEANGHHQLLTALNPGTTRARYNRRPSKGQESGPARSMPRLN